MKLWAGQWIEMTMMCDGSLSLGLGLGKDLILEKPRIQLIRGEIIV